MPISGAFQALVMGGATGEDDGGFGSRQPALGDTDSVMGYHWARDGEDARVIGVVAQWRQSSLGCGHPAEAWGIQ